MRKLTRCLPALMRSAAHALAMRVAISCQPAVLKKFPLLHFLQEDAKSACGRLVSDKNRDKEQVIVVECSSCKTERSQPSNTIFALPFPTASSDSEVDELRNVCVRLYVCVPCMCLARYLLLLPRAHTTALSLLHFVSVPLSCPLALSFWQVAGEVDDLDLGMDKKKKVISRSLVLVLHSCFHILPHPYSSRITFVAHSCNTRPGKRKEHRFGDGQS